MGAKIKMTYSKQIANLEAAQKRILKAYQVFNPNASSEFAIIYFPQTQVNSTSQLYHRIRDRIEELRGGE